MIQTGRKRRKIWTWFRVGILGVMALAAGSLYTPYPLALARYVWGVGKGQNAPKKPVRVVEEKPKVKEEPKPEVKPVVALPAEPQLAVPWRPEEAFTMPDVVLPPFPPALPEKVSDGTFRHINELGAGINMKSGVEFKPGTTAAQDRKKKDAYMVHLSMSLFQPKAASGEDLLKTNPQLPEVFAKYHDLMGAAKVSPWFHALYLHKQNRIRKNAATLSRLLDRHNFYDTDTILQIEAPGSGRRVLWMQSDMDVVADGSDGDRLPRMPEKVLDSDYYQPSTSYRWRKIGKKVNPLLPRWEDRLAKLKKNRKSSRDAIRHAEMVVADLKLFSFLLTEYDPFIVIPLTFKEGKDDTFRPQPGDYAVVVVGNRVIPAMVGDFGPKFKTGEASLRLNRIVNPRATLYARGVSDLSVSYVIFPGSKEEKNGPPDYERLNARCRELVEEIGGLGPNAEFKHVKDLLPKQD